MTRPTTDTKQFFALRCLVASVWTGFTISYILLLIIKFIINVLYL